MSTLEELGIIIPPRAEGHVSVEDLMGRIHEAIRQKRKEGIYLDLRLDREVALELENLAEWSRLDTAVAEEIVADSGEWNVRPDYAITTHRRGIGSLVVLFKRLVRPFVRLYTDFIVFRQSQVNLFAVHSIRSLVRDMVLLRRDSRELRHKCTVLEREVHRLSMRLMEQGIELAPGILPRWTGPAETGKDGGAAEETGSQSG